MLLYIRQALSAAAENGLLTTPEQLRQAIMSGAANRVRPKAMTVSVIVLGLTPIMLSEGTGSDVMQRIAAPMIGGMISAPIVSMILIPVVVYMLMLKELKSSQSNISESKTNASKTTKLEKNKLGERHE